MMILALLVSFAHALPAVNDPTIVKLKTEKITVGGQKVTAEIADDDASRERGLMHRTKLPENEGMLFVFDQPQPLSFWMKNTLIPLNIGYFDEDGKLLQTYEMVPAVMGEAHPMTYPCRAPAKYALEMNKGWFTKHHLQPGAVLKRPDLRRAKH